MTIVGEIMKNEIAHAKASGDPYQRMAAEAVENSGHFEDTNNENAAERFVIDTKDELELGVDGLVRINTMVTARQLSEHEHVSPG